MDLIGKIYKGGVIAPGINISLNTLINKEVLGRAAEPWEIANIILFLSSEQSSFMTGEVLSASSQRA